MSDERTPLNRITRGIGLWVAVVLATLVFGGTDTFLQMQIVAHDMTGPLAFVHYLFFIYSPFGLSGMCALLFAPLVAYPFRDFLVAKGYSHTGAAIICGVIALVGAVAAYWIILASWVAITGLIARSR